MFSSCARVLKNLGSFCFNRPAVTGLFLGMGSCVAYMFTVSKKLECNYKENHLPHILPRNITIPVGLDNITRPCHIIWTAGNCLLECLNKTQQREIEIGAKTYSRDEPTVNYVLIMVGAILAVFLGKGLYMAYDKFCVRHTIVPPIIPPPSNEKIQPIDITIDRGSLETPLLEQNNEAKELGSMPTLSFFLTREAQDRVRDSKGSDSPRFQAEFKKVALEFAADFAQSSHAQQDLTLGLLQVYGGAADEEVGTILSHFKRDPESYGQGEGNRPRSPTNS